MQHPSDPVPAPAGTEGTTWDPCPPPPCTHTPLIPAQTQHKPGRAGLIGRQRGLSSSQHRISPDLGLETQFHFICHASASAHNRAKPVTCQVGFAARSPDGAAQAPAAPLHPRGGTCRSHCWGTCTDPPSASPRGPSTAGSTWAPSGADEQPICVPGQEENCLLAVRACRGFPPCCGTPGRHFRVFLGSF